VLDLPGGGPDGGNEVASPGPAEPRRQDRHTVEAGAGELTLGSRDSVVRCPWHKWEFDIATGRCLVDERLRVRRYAVRLEDDEVVITLDRPA
jgi:hypothetical protein